MSHPVVTVMLGTLLSGPLGIRDLLFEGLVQGHLRDEGTWVPQRTKSCGLLYYLQLPTLTTSERSEFVIREMARQF